MHHFTVEEEELWYDKLGQAFDYFGYRKQYGWTFEQYVGYVKNGTLQQILGQA